MKVDDKVYYIDSYRCKLLEFIITGFKGIMISAYNDEYGFGEYLHPRDPMLYSSKREAIKGLNFMLECKKG